MLDFIAVVIAAAILWKVRNMSTELQNLREEIAENTSATDAAVTLMNGIENRIREALMQEDDDLRAEAEALANELSANSERLAAAVTANSGADDDSDTVLSHDDQIEAENEEELENVDGDEEAPEGVSVDTEVPATPSDDTVRAGEGVTGPDSAVDTTIGGEASHIASSEGAAAESSSGIGGNPFAGNVSESGTNSATGEVTTTTSDSTVETQPDSEPPIDEETGEEEEPSA